MQKLILVGAGHAHLHIIKKWMKEPLEDVEVTLISASNYQYYSGMFSGYAEGIYSLEDIRINVEEMCKKANISWYQQAVVSVDPKQKMLLTDQGEVMSYDVLSFDIGSLSANTDIKGVKEYAKRIKPNYHYPQMMEEMQQSENPVIVGGGVAGTELALSLEAWRTKNKLTSPVKLVSSSSRLLEQESEKASEKIQKLLQKRNIELHLNKRVVEINQINIIVEDSEKISYKDVMWLTGPQAPDLFRVSKLPMDSKGYLLVESTLQVKEYPAIFGAGDCITLSHAPDTPKNGVFAIREAPILWENIRGFLQNGQGSHYHPQKRYLAIMSTGYEEGFLLYNPLYLQNRWAWKLKHRIDKKFIVPYQELS